MADQISVPCDIAIPQVFHDGPVDMDLVRRHVETAEAMGYHGLWVQERFIGESPTLEGLSLLCYVAALTGTNAMYRLSRALSNIEQFEPELDTSTGLFDHLSTFAIEHRPSPSNIEEIIAEVEPTNPRFASLLKALSRMTLTPTMIRGGIKSNSVPESIRLTCDVRTLPHQDEQYVREQVEQVLEGIPGIDFEIDYMAQPNSSPFDTALSQSIQSVTAQALERDDIQWVPAISNGFTDSRFTRPLGIVTYGFSGSHPDDDPMITFTHGTNESVGIKSLVSGTKIMLGLACDMLAPK